MSDQEQIDVTLAGTAMSCTLISMTRVGTLWEAKVRCGDGTTRTARSANKNQSKQLACMKCAEPAGEGGE